VSCRCAAIHCIFKQAMPGRKKRELVNGRNSKPRPMHISLYNKLLALVPMNRVS
jgi:hypothetical protein